MKIAVPVFNNRLHGHFGGARHFALVEVDEQTRTVLGTQTLEAPPHTPGAFPRWLREQGAKVIIAGGIGQRALDNFALHGITVRAGQPETPVDVLVAAYLQGQLTAVPAGCAHHGEHGDHGGHDHDHGDHQP